MFRGHLSGTNHNIPNIMDEEAEEFVASQGSLHDRIKSTTICHISSSNHAR